MAAYLLKDARGEFASHDVYDAWEGFQDLGEEVRVFSEEMLHRGVMYQQREDVVVGWVRTVSAAWDQVGVTLPVPFDYPSALTPWLCRKLRRATLGDLTCETGPVFVKPAVQAKLFDGRLWTPGATIPGRHAPDTAIWISEAVVWRTEWRVYVLHGAIIGAYPYRGDFRVAVDWSVVDAMVAAWGDAPVGYALDIGMIADGRTALIEANDGWALGNYGLLPRDYARLLRARWDEVIAPAE